MKIFSFCVGFMFGASSLRMRQGSVSIWYWVIAIFIMAVIMALGDIIFDKAEKTVEERLKERDEMEKKMWDRKV